MVNNMEVKVMAPAKINLMLDVTGKRDDGYHTLTTIMQTVSLADIVTITEQNSDCIVVNTNDSSIPSDKNNIAYRAAEKFIEYTNIEYNGLNIHIQKNIPSQAGLGGGSADAAAVLVGLNYMYGTGLSVEQLCDVAVSIGADVPFCVAGGTKLCTGIGEIMADVTPLEECKIVIAKGNSGVSTKNAFKKIDSIVVKENHTYSCYDGSLCSVKRIGYNIFEEVAENDDISYIKDKRISMGAEYSAMSGSGSAVFGLFADNNIAQQCCTFLRETGFFSDLCYPISNSTKVIV